ncbi:MAG TPA: class I SAM-dependent rRNA methyltransferase [Planctomycetota bacterium]|nr:class I SAM-dependent rRNA methyltransferase [Planctomycetota bacterium]
MAQLPVVRLKTQRNSNHPWVFGKMVGHPDRRVGPGTLVEARDRDGGFVGRGIYNPAKTIALRLLTEFPAEQIDDDFFRRRLTEAKALRESVLRLPEVTDSYRLVHSESDGLSGLIVDKFADVLVVEPFSAGYLALGPAVIRVLQELYPNAWVCFRPDPRTEEVEGVSFAPLVRKYPAPDGVEIRENRLRMWVDFKSGHKTGFFLDQRDNRSRAAAMARGREVLDLCCYTGGFTISTLLGGAARATGVDLDEKALDTAGRNAKLNGVSPELVHANAFDFLRQSAAAGRKWDMVIADPSKLAGVRAEISRGMRTYGDLNKLAIEAVRPGGILVTCSCSGLISPDAFMSIVRNSAGEAGTTLKVLEYAGAASDHPVASNFPEGRYLKALFAQVFPGKKMPRRPPMAERAEAGPRDARHPAKSTPRPARPASPDPSAP